MDERALVLDGNAVAGIFAEVFAHEMTASRGECASCGAVDLLGGALVYGGPRAPGAVVRCRSCTAVLAVFVRVEAGWRVSLGGLRWVEVHST